ncbi:hypothetical protein H0G86_012711 [Trichoderma simmonsii]|uniref:Uncharacterized protein n=1 Tax=Trichoderma simmonsii TaxID=1491479 RepID=A0A8G0LSZ1_9HYPO|nr:hypothetical protein H0G86_012711 [Trichoderma simmonsii]
MTKRVCNNYYKLPLAKEQAKERCHVPLQCTPVQNKHFLRHFPAQVPFFGMVEDRDWVSRHMTAFLTRSKPRLLPKMLSAADAPKANTRRWGRLDDTRARLSNTSV